MVILLYIPKHGFWYLMHLPQCVSGHAATLFFFKEKVRPPGRARAAALGSAILPECFLQNGSN
jgi:hypothetical protein